MIFYWKTYHTILLVDSLSLQDLRFFCTIAMSSVKIDSACSKEWAAVISAILSTFIYLSEVVSGKPEV